jgi:hypothetical protein
VIRIIATADRNGSVRSRSSTGAKARDDRSLKTCIGSIPARCNSPDAELADDRWRRYDDIAPNIMHFGTTAGRMLRKHKIPGSRTARGVRATRAQC